MKVLQIAFLLSFAVLVLIVPYLIFNLIRGESGNQYLIIFIAVIFAVNLILIIRKLFRLKKERQK